MAQAQARGQASRQSSYAAGVAAESRARQLLEGKKYRILAQRYKSPAGEIDLIAQKGDHLAFVEVKKRRTIDEAAWAVPPRQQMRIASSAEAFLAGHQEFSQYSASFDVVLVTADNRCAHIEHAFFA
jgi:putative endonuclease